MSTDTAKYDVTKPEELRDMLVEFMAVLDSDSYYRYETANSFLRSKGLLAACLHKKHKAATNVIGSPPGYYICLDCKESFTVWNETDWWKDTEQGRQAIARGELIINGHLWNENGFVEK